MKTTRTNADSSVGGDGTMLIIFGGLPGTGKTTLARMLAVQLRATYVRIDSIEQAIRESAVFAGIINDAGYRAAYAIAADNVRLGRTVVADSVNPLPITRDAWRAAADGTPARVIEIEVVCSDTAEHRRRVESRQPDIPGFALPPWQEVCEREYVSWDRVHIVIDTAGRPIDQTLSALWSAVSESNAAQK
jgi:predicted kinase